MAEMYINGVSTRKVNQVLEELCGLEVTSIRGSRATRRLDEELEKRRNRPFGHTSFVQLDARRENLHSAA